MFEIIKRHPWKTGFLVGIGATAVLWLRTEKRFKRLQAERNFTGAYPRNSGAISAVTGGDPEDINMMPAVLADTPENPIYDGSSLSKAK